MMMRADEGYTPVEGCTAEELLACLVADDMDACIAECGNGSEEPEEPTNPGYAKVTTKAAADQTVALNAVDKKIGTVTLKAGENDTTVTNIEITKSGLGNKADVANVQLMKNGEYVTNLGTLNGNNIAKLRFRPNITIKAGKSETFDVVVSMAGSGAATPNGQHSFAVTSLTVANGKFNGTPAKLGNITTSNYSVSETDVSIAGKTLKAGESNKEIATITIDPSVKSTLESITLTATVSGANEDLFNVFQNVRAYVDNNVIGDVAVNAETLVISNLNKTIDKNDDLDIVLKGTDIFVGEEIDVILEAETGHVVIYEDNTNERMNSLYASGNVDVKGVDLKITNNTTATQTVSTNTKNVELLNMTVSSSNEMDITSFYVKFPLTGSNFTGAFDDEEVTLYIDGVDYTIKASDLGDDGMVEYSDKYDAFTVAANNSVRVQIKGTPITGTTINGIIFGITEAKNIDTNTKFDVNLSKNAHKTIVKDGNVTVSKAGNSSANTIEMGTESDVLLFKIKSPSEDVRLDSISLNILGEDSLDVLSGRQTSPITNIALYKEGEESPLVDFDFENDMTNWDTGTAEEISTGLSLDLDTTITIEAGNTENFIIKATFDNEVVADLGNLFSFELNSTSLYGLTSKADINNTTVVKSTKYTVVTDKPEITLDKNGEYINVTVANNSTYDFVLQSGTVAEETGSIAIDIKSVATQNDNYLLNLSSGLAIEVLDGENGNRLGTGTYANGVITVIFDDDFVVSEGSEELFTIKLVSTNEILSTYYNVSKKTIDFNYRDDDDGLSKYINVKY